MKRRLWKDKDGFTLVELIVVLVILGILIALLVPSLTGYIDKARKKTKLAECRQVVTAVQTELSELYGAAESADLTTLTSMINAQKDMVLKLSEAPGEIVGDIEVQDKAAVKRLMYEAKDGTRVIYEKGHEPEYWVEDAGAGYSKDAPGYWRWASGLSPDEYSVDVFLDENGKVKDEYKEYFGEQAYNVRNSASRRLQAAYLKKYGSYQKVNWDHINVPVAIPEDRDEYVWKPIVAKGNETILVAERGGQMGQSRAAVIYYSGKYYYHPNWNGTKVDLATVMDKAEFDLSTLGDGKNWIEIK